MKAIPGSRKQSGLDSTRPSRSLLTPALAAAVLGLAPFAAHAQIVAVEGTADAQIRSSDDFMYTDGNHEVMGGPPLLTTTGMAWVVGDGSNNAGFAEGSWQAHAGWDRLGVRASAEGAASLPEGSSFEYSRSFTTTRSFASLSIPDLVITGPGDFTTISLNLLFNGLMAGGLDSGAGVGVRSSQVALGTGVSGGQQMSGAFSGLWDFWQSPWTMSESSTGILGPDYHGGPVDLTTGLWEVPTGTPLTLSLALQATVALDLYAYSATEVSGSIMMDAFHSLSFPIGSPVFNLPDGYTAHAPSYGIVDNLFAPIPEPGEYAALAGLGLLGFALWRRTRRA